MADTSDNMIKTLLEKGTVETIVEEDLNKKLKSGKSLRIKFGIDPTGSDLHIGHAVVLRKLKQFQEAGHTVILLIGDYTGKIGDPTGRIETRKKLTDEEIKENMKNYTDQAGKILDMSKIEVRYNSEWLSNLHMSELFELTALKTVAQMLHRSDFKERMKKDIDISLSEFLYPIMQGYDSVILKADVELGGTEQKFNMLVGRDLQKHYDQPPQDVMTLPILEGLDGVQKMSKSYDNYIGLTEEPDQMYGKVMSIPDNLILKYFELATDVSLEQINEFKKALDEGENPMNLKKQLGREIVTLYHSEDAAKKAEEGFTKVFSEHKLPDEIETREISGKSMNIVELISSTDMAPSKSEARRLIQQGAVKINEEKVEEVDKDIDLSEEVLLQVGKRKILKITGK